ncbi:MAG TPA: AAA family ATPase [Solirubrobacteraceae bacterium]|jgi:DNA-binding CsgD family transcriptional regulator
MPLREADRRGRAVRGQNGLLEREDALIAIGAVLDDARAGVGGALLISGHPGMGKTRLHEATLDEARRRELLVLRASGSELEQNLAFGLAAQLLRSLLGQLPDTQRTRLIEHAPSRVRRLEGIGETDAEPDGSEDLAVSHGLFALIAGAAESAPAVIAIDDLHWCDLASLEFVLYLLHRLDELPAAVVLTSRLLTRDEGPGMLDEIAVDPRLETTELTPLGLSAVDELVRKHLGRRADAELVAVCADVTAGNPFYLHELLLALAEERQLDSGQLVRLARALAPDTVTRSLRVRVGRLGESATALAAAVAILGDDVPLRHAAVLSALEIADASSAADALASVEVLLAREPLRFVHPLVRQAVTQDIPASLRGGRHLDAARLLYAEGFGAERVAAHLLLGRAEGNPWVVERLRAAAREAASRSAPQSVARYLQRALEEPPAPESRSEVLAELGMAEATFGAPEAVEHLAAAAAASEDPRRRAELALRQGRALATAGSHEQASAAYDAGLAELPEEPSDPADRELRDQLQTAYVVTAALVPSLQARALERSAQALDATGARPKTQGQRLLLARLATRAAATGEPAEVADQLAERAWDGGMLLEQADPQWIGWRTVASVFLMTGALERAMEIADAALEDARRRGLVLGFATVSYVRGLPQLWQGRVDAALVDLEQARDARRYGWREFARSAAAHYALCLVERGELERAEKVLEEDGPIDPPRDLEDVLRMFSMAELRLAAGRPEDALELAEAVGGRVEASLPYFGYCPWRGTAAQAAIALGDTERALALSRKVLARSDRTGVLHERIRALRILGLSEGGAAGIETLRAAVELGTSSPHRLETVRALVDLGAALRRANRRAEARPLLTQAADVARRGGALALRERARTELAATGARPRREALLTGPDSLTPSERRIAELAASGQSNREIAQALFVTPKTVEYHLRNSYRKLEIRGRRELSRALAGGG